MRERPNLGIALTLRRRADDTYQIAVASVVRREVHDGCRLSTRASHTLKLLCRSMFCIHLHTQEGSARTNISCCAACFWDGNGSVGARGGLKCVSRGVGGDVEEWPKQEKKTEGVSLVFYINKCGTEKERERER